MSALAALEAAVRAAGLAPRGALTLRPEERAGRLEGFASIALVGFAGRIGWDAFAASPEALDEAPDPLDRWSRRVLDAVAAPFGAMALDPSDGPPYLPFQQWARRADAAFPSPLGLLIHAEHGLWHSYRGALALREEIAAVPPSGHSPCEACAGSPCLTTCPVGAFTRAGYDVRACADYLRSPAGADCLNAGCRARRACPVGEVYSRDQAAFHMRAFLQARPPNLAQ